MNCTNTVNTQYNYYSVLSLFVILFCWATECTLGLIYVKHLSDKRMLGWENQHIVNSC